MKTVVVLLTLMAVLAAVVPASACENHMTGVSVAPGGGGLVVSWTYQNQCGSVCLFKVEAQCCDGGNWNTLIDNYRLSSYTYVPAIECETGWRFRVTMVQGCTEDVCYAETLCN